MPSRILDLDACPCARIGSKQARLIIRTRPELTACTRCGEDVWVTVAGQESGLPPVCVECLVPR